jgi:hypothetical protein
MSTFVAEEKVITEEEVERLVRVANKPPIDECLSLYDFEVSSPPSARLREI